MGERNEATAGTNANTTGGKPRLLAVDDEVDMLDFVERVFRRDYQVTRAQSVDDALVALAGARFDVVVTDRRMPRRGGLELLSLVASMLPNAVRVLLTGYGESIVNEKSADWQLVDAWVSKPVDSAALREAVRDATLRRPSSG